MVFRFLLVALHMETLVKQTTRNGLRSALKQLPQSSRVRNTYAEAFVRIDSQEDLRGIAYAALSWLSYAERPMTLRELQCALALPVTGVPLDDADFPVESAILTACVGLISRNTQSGNVDFTREHLIKLYDSLRNGICRLYCSRACPNHETGSHVFVSQAS
jgi:hypothetical protein